MSNLQSSHAAVVPATEQRLDRHPAAIYLAGLSKSSRRVMASALDTVAQIITGDDDRFDIPWHEVRFQHTQAVRSVLRIPRRIAFCRLSEALSEQRGSWNFWCELCRNSWYWVNFKEFAEQMISEEENFRQQLENGTYSNKDIVF